ncbi:MAG: hypothetical protein FWH01_06515 [Oscillospiraceae bacterium]|nr:hypothetical protein [Oscillospiraceae bacterium]
MKTKLGISIGLLGAAVYFVALFDGFLALTLIAGYILLFEESEWLKKAAVKAFAILVGVALLRALIALVPDLFNLINNFIGIFGQSFTVRPVTSFISFVDTALVIGRKLLMLMLGLQALTQNSIAVGPIDKLVDKHMKAE